MHRICILGMDWRKRCSWHSEPGVFLSFLSVCSQYFLCDRRCGRFALKTLNCIGDLAACTGAKATEEREQADGNLSKGEYSSCTWLCICKDKPGSRDVQLEIKTHDK